MTATTDRHCLQVIRAAKGLGLPDGQTRRAVIVCWTACGGETAWQVYANDGTSTLHKLGDGQLTAHEREVARLSMSCGVPYDAVGHNLDSVGILQQRPGAGWGDPLDLMDVYTAAIRFFRGHGGNMGMLDKPDWLTGEAWYVAWEVQQCSRDDRSVYQKVGAQAVNDINRLWADDQPREWIDMVSKDEFVQGLREATAGMKADIINEIKYGNDKIMAGKAGDPPDFNIAGVYARATKLQIVISDDSPGVFAVGPGVFIHIPTPEYLNVGRSVGYLSEDSRTTNARGLDVLKSLALQPNYDGQPSLQPGI